jgi:hypothetical protein
MDGALTEEKENNMTNGPANKFQDGCLKVVVWRNTSTEGRAYYSANHTRGYKASDDTWRETDSINADDMLPLAELYREAYAWIKNQKRADAKARKESEQAA